MLFPFPLFPKVKVFTLSLCLFFYVIFFWNLEDNCKISKYYLIHKRIKDSASFVFVLIFLKNFLSLSHIQLFATPWTTAWTARLSCPSPPSRACSNSCPLSPWRYPTISSSVALFFSCLQSFPASGSFLPFSSVIWARYLTLSPSLSWFTLIPVLRRTYRISVDLS